MLGVLLSALIRLLFWAPLALVRLRRRRQLGYGAVVEMSFGGRGRPVDLPELARELIRIAEDPRVRGVSLKLWLPGAGLVGASELRSAIARLRARGRRVSVYLETAGTAALYAVSTADHLVLSPSTDLYLLGLGGEQIYFGDALSRLGVEAELVAAGRYKSFGEPYTRGFPSRHGREALATLLGDLMAQVVDGIAEGRGLTAERVVALMGDSPLSPQDAVEAGLIDAVGTVEAADEWLDKALGDEPPVVHEGAYRRWARWERWLTSRGRRRPLVAVLHLEGPVVHGLELSRSAGTSIDSERVIPVLESLAEDRRVRAVVLHINSPGGSAHASDLIARAIEKVGHGKPVIAVFGDVAASGGYYIAAPCAEILAPAMGITGSIGVVGGKLVFGPALARFGVHADRVVAGPNAGLFGPWTPFDDGQRARFQRSLARTYERFLRVVAGGRRQPMSGVAEVAEGRVWTGRQALALGLVDALGGVDAAVERARVRASLPAVNAVHISFPPPRFAAVNALLGRASVSGPIDWLSQLGPSGRRLALLAAMPGEPLALMPWVVTVD